ncbi:unnamed protein product [Arctia plantaginis]|uniref:Uncharacterized protein n=1 Tax=Arctia plantaginis TaxID=874455 RepID=A0A8S1AMC2_ARCPL|nr:unnamed protein product [Arctia plantaginis]
MEWSATCFLLAVMSHGGSGVTKSGIEQFWTDDYKIFEQVYGKTSDKEIYGETLPASITYSRNHDLNKDASQKNERYLINYDEPESEQMDTYNFGNLYSNALNQQTLKLLNRKPATSSINFVSYSNFKPISSESDPDTYDYLKHLEEFNSEDKYNSPKTVGGFKPYINFEDKDPEETDAYKNIQDILEAHQANKESNNYKKENDNNSKYLTYPKNKKKKPPRVHNDYNKPRCVNGSCRKRGASYRSRNRPYRWTPSLKTVVVI